MLSEESYAQLWDVLKVRYGVQVRSDRGGERGWRGGPARLGAGAVPARCHRHWAYGALTQVRPAYGVGKVIYCTKKKNSAARCSTGV